MKNAINMLFSLVAVVLTISYVWQNNRVPIPKQATWDDVQMEAAAGGYRIITTDEFARLHRLDPSNMLVVDTRQEWEYRTGHIKGAQNFPMEPTWWTRWRNAKELRALLGPDKERVLVFY